MSLCRCGVFMHPPLWMYLIIPHTKVQKATFNYFCIFFWMFEDCILLKIFPLYNYFYMYKFGWILYQGLTFTVILGFTRSCTFWGESLFWWCHPLGRSPLWSLTVSISTRSCGVESWFCLNTISTKQISALHF